MNIAIVHDFLNQFGGAERVVGYFLRIFPKAPVFTSIYFPDDTFNFFREAEISTTFMQKIPGIRKYFKRLFVFYPFAFKKLRLKNFEIILSSSSSFAHFINKGKNSIHVNYCHTPPRFLWETESYLEGEKLSGLLYKLIKPPLGFLRKWDLKQSQSIDYFVANSEYVRKKIKNIYGRDSYVIHPPIELQKYKFSKEKEDYYLVVSRLKGYKRVDIAIEAFNNLGKRLLIVGGGEDEVGLRKISGMNIEFLGRVSDNELIGLYSKAKALVFTGKEDFGLTPLEAQASGTPVIAFNEGGAAETVINCKTGFFFDKQSPEALAATIREFEKNPIDPEACRENAVKFDFNIFESAIKAFLSNVYNERFS